MSGNRDQNEMPSVAETAAFFENLFTIVVRCHANVIYVFTRHRFGTHYFGLPEVLSIFAPILALGWLPTEAVMNSTLLPYLGHAYFIGMILRRMTASATWNGFPVHSKYNGYPWICHFLPMTEETAKKIGEPLFVLSCAMPIAALDPALCLFTAVGAGAVLFDHGIHATHLENRARRVRDAEIESDILSDEIERYR